MKKIDFEDVWRTRSGRVAQRKNDHACDQQHPTAPTRGQHRQHGRLDHHSRLNQALANPAR